jgi:hypothetical protein
VGVDTIVLNRMPRTSGRSVSLKDMNLTRSGSVASRPRFGCYSPARTGSAGQAPAERGGLRQQGRSNVYINVLLLSQINSNKQCFHNLYAYLSAARNRTSGSGNTLKGTPVDDCGGYLHARSLPVRKDIPWKQNL